MKKFNLISLISLLLCLVLCAVGCQGTGNENSTGEQGTGAPVTDAASQGAQDVPPVTVTVDSVMSNFVSIEHFDNGALKVDKSLTDEYGTFVNSTTYSENLVVFRKQAKDYMNNLTETFTVYSLKDAAVVSTFTHTYADENYNRLDKFDNPVRPATEFSVWTDTLDGEVDYITVVNITNTEIDGELVEENELKDSYASTYTVDFYDAKGTHIATTNTVDFGEVIDYNDTELKASFGKVGAIFNIEENKLVKTYDADIGTQNVGYDYSNDRYNYYLNTPYGTVDYGSPIGFGGKIEVYTKSGELVCEYIYTDYAMMSSANVLANGDIMIQNLNTTESFNYDILTSGMKMDLQTLILDVETGKVTEVEFNYLLMALYDEQDREDMTEEMLGVGVKMTFNEQNVRNMAMGVKIENGMIQTEVTDMIFFDDLLNVNYVMDKLVPEQDMDGEYMPLANGYFLASVKGGISDHAIIKDGKVVSYVPEDAIVTDYAIITEGAIYDFAMDVIFDLDPDEEEDEAEDENTDTDTDIDDLEPTAPIAPDVTDYVYQGYIGKYAVYSVYDFEVYVDEDENEIKNFIYFVDMTNGSITTLEDTRIEDMNDEFITLYDQETELYSVYNKNNECIFVSEYQVEIHYNYSVDVYTALMWCEGEGYLFTLAYGAAN